MYAVINVLTIVIMHD